jgi:hypothetical protein
VIGSIVGAVRQGYPYRSTTAIGADMPPVELLTPTEIEARRRELLESIGMDENMLRERARSYLLSAEEAGVLTELDGLEFLLGK